MEIKKYYIKGHGIGAIIEDANGMVTVLFDSGETKSLSKRLNTFEDPSKAATANKWAKANAAAKAKKEKAAADYAAYTATRTEDQRIADELTAWGASMYKDGSLMTEREGILHEVSMQTGFAGDVAKTCLKYGKVSQKQAAIIAKAYINR
jgi:hypothetical protein